MSWLSNLAKQGEALLDNLDKQAGAAIETAEKKIEEIKEKRENEKFDADFPPLSGGMDRSASMTSMNRSFGPVRTASPKHSRNSSRDLRLDRELTSSPSRLTGSPRMSPVPRRPVKKDKNSDDESSESGMNLLRKPPTPPSGRTTPGTNFGNDSEFEVVSAPGSVVGERRDEPMDLQLENKLLRQEMNSLNMEISRIMDVQRKTERELTLTNSELQRRRQSEIDEKDAELGKGFIILLVYHIEFGED